MSKNKEEIKYYSGELINKGAYTCHLCHFEVISLKDDFILPTCPCCENKLFFIFNAKNLNVIK